MIVSRCEKMLSWSLRQLEFLTGCFTPRLISVPSTQRKDRGKCSFTVLFSAGRQSVCEQQRYKESNNSLPPPPTTHTHTQAQPPTQAHSRAHTHTHTQMCGGRRAIPFFLKKPKGSKPLLARAILSMLARQAAELSSSSAQTCALPFSF